MVNSAAMPAGYSKRTLIDKLGIRPGTRIALLHAPLGFDITLGPLPHATVALTRLSKEMDFVHAFFRDSGALDRDFPRLKKALKQDGVLWISWPKKAAKVETDVTENTVRETGLRHGLVDIKVCAVDDVWSGLKFMYRLKDRTRCPTALKRKTA